LKELLELFKTRQQIIFVVIDNDLHAVEADPAYDKFLECAQEARAACIVSRDKHLKRLRELKGMPILSPAKFIATYPFLSQSAGLY
jgi:predicted nucleic acid-binding protein